MMNWEDKETLFRTAIKDNGDRIYRICRCYLKNQDERNDVYQETLMHIWQNLHNFKGESDIGTWIYRITVNTCLGHIRSETRRNIIIGEKPLESCENIPEQISNEERQSAEDDLERLYRAINDLPPLDRMLVSLYLEDMGSKEMADILGISENNVRVKIYRIKAHLKQQLGEK